MQKTFKAGALPSARDIRDIKDPTLSLASPYPESHETEFPGFTGEDRQALYDRYQRNVGVCVACAVATYVEYLYWLKTGKYERLSVAFLYIAIKRLVDGNPYEGTSLRSGIRAAMKYGVCRESTFPTDYSLSHAEFLSQWVPDAAWTEALDFTIGGYVSVPVDRSLMAAAIHKYGLLLTRMEVGDSWWSPSWLPKDIFPLRKSKSVVSGHAVDHHRYALSDGTELGFLNWWSGRWGRRGHGEHVLEDYAPTECWALTLDSVAQFRNQGPTVSEGVWRSLLEILRRFGPLKALIPRI